jgi:hypothetical protein
VSYVVLALVHPLITVPISPRIYFGVSLFSLLRSTMHAFNSMYISSIHRSHGIFGKALRYGFGSRFLE